MIELSRADSIGAMRFSSTSVFFPVLSNLSYKFPLNELQCCDAFAARGERVSAQRLILFFLNRKGV